MSMHIMDAYTLYFWYSNKMLHERIYQVILMNRIKVRFNIFYWKQRLVFMEIARFETFFISTITRHVNVTNAKE